MFTGCLSKRFHKWETQKKRFHNCYSGDLEEELISIVVTLLLLLFKIGLIALFFVQYWLSNIYGIFLTDTHYCYGESNEEVDSDAGQQHVNSSSSEGLVR